MATPLVVIGGGRMGEALVRGLAGPGGHQPGLDRAGRSTTAPIVVVEASAARRAELVAIVEPLDGVSVAEQAPDEADAVLAVKPADVAGACAELRQRRVRRVLSIAAGVTLARIEGWVGGAVPVVRAMPNTPALVGAGASAIAGGTHAGVADLDWAEAVLGSVGIVVRVPEGLLDAVTGLSGSGPAYVFLLAEALIDAGVLAGLPRPTATELATQTLLGSARLLAESGQSAEALRAAVTSPGGTTAAGLQALERRALRAAVLEAVTAATARSAELGRA